MLSAHHRGRHSELAETGCRYADSPACRSKWDIAHCGNGKFTEGVLVINVGMSEHLPEYVFPIDVGPGMRPGLP
jgi:hypothetical protein